MTDLASVMARRQLGARTASPHDTTSPLSSAPPQLVVSVTAYSLADAAQVGFALGIVVGLALALIVVTLAGVML